MKSNRKCVIAIDGPAGAGKSTVAAKLAMRLGFIHLNSGALYRAVALKALELKVSLQDKVALVNIADSLEFKFFLLDRSTQLTVNGEEILARLYQPEVAAAASKIATVAELRDKLNVVQREVALLHPVILEGRDAGSVVFPDAEAKFFLVADLDERTRRRHAELVGKGLQVEFAAIRAEILERDNRDETREVAPQKQAEDSILIDTSGKDVEAVIEEIVANLRSKGLV